VRIYLSENHKVAKEILEAIWKSYKSGHMREKVVGKEEE